VVAGRRLSAGIVVVALTLVAGCGGGGKGGTSSHSASGSGGDTKITIAPVNGAAQTRPDLPVTVTAVGGKLATVTVRSATGTPAAGTFNPAHSAWTSTGTLQVAAHYTVTATAKDGDKSTTATSAFQTMTPLQTFGISDITPMPGETIGVGMPFTITFTDPVANRANVERALQVTSDKRDVGAWHWMDSTHVVYRTRVYWQPHQNVTVTANLNGVRGAKGVYGTKDVSRSFKIGASHITTVDTKAHKLTVDVDGRQVRSTPESAGKATSYDTTTTDGIHAVMGKESPVTMTSSWMGATKPSDPGYYSEVIYSAVQISNSGEYVHAFPWSAEQNTVNISHGCVHTPPSFAAWFFKLSMRGDIVSVTGTKRPMPYNDGYGYWNLSWDKWLQGSALQH
jgi:lipoprotein-anchoring transpeptidase ErfK/SrfK